MTVGVWEDGFVGLDDIEIVDWFKWLGLEGVEKLEKWGANKWRWRGSGKFAGYHRIKEIYGRINRRRHSVRKSGFMKNNIPRNESSMWV